MKKVIVRRGRRFLLFVETGARDEDYQKYEDLRQEIWEEPDDHFSSRRNMAGENYFSCGGSLFTGAYSEDENGRIPRRPEQFVGFTYGYVGAMDKNIGYRRRDNLHFYSQYAAVREDMRRFGLGSALKHHQADAVQNILGVDVISCTFDPLTGVNANRNIHKLGMRVEKYIASCYRNFGGRLNREDIPSDRFYVTWNLQNRRQKPVSLDSKKLTADAAWALLARTAQIKGSGGRMEIQVPGQKISTSGDLESDIVLVEIPGDFYHMLRSTDTGDPTVRRIPLEWRMASRRVFSLLMECGFRVFDFQRSTLEGGIRNVYVLKKEV